MSNSDMNVQRCCECCRPANWLSPDHKCIDCVEKQPEEDTAKPIKTMADAVREHNKLYGIGV